MCVLGVVFLKKRTVQWGVFDVAYIVFTIGAWIDVYAVMRSVLSDVVYRYDV